MKFPKRQRRSGSNPEKVDVCLGGRDKAVGGDGNRGAVVVGDHNRVEVFGTLERARRRVEALTLGEVPSRAAVPPGSVMPLRPSRYFVGREVKG